MATAAPGQRQVYFEDVEVGAALLTPGMTLTEAHVALFSGLMQDPGSPDPGAVPALLPLCLSSGLGWRGAQPPLAVLAFLGFQWRFPRPPSGGAPAQPSPEDRQSGRRAGTAPGSGVPGSRVMPEKRATCVSVRVIPGVSSDAPTSTSSK